jgi:hypothetical protein
MVNQQATRSKCLRISIVHVDRVVFKWQEFQRTKVCTLDTTVGAQCPIFVSEDYGPQTAFQFMFTESGQKPK